MVSGIYKITNKINNHFYIGQSKNIEKRWKDHIKTAKENKNRTVLQKAFCKYGVDNFTFEILEKCPTDKLDEKEIFYIAKLKPEYNMNLGGSGNKGYIVTNETKESLRQYGRDQWNSYDEETKNKIIRNQLKGPKKGSHRSEETKRLLSIKSKNYFEKNNGMSEECKRKISESLRGKKRPNLSHYKAVIGVSEHGTKFFFECIKDAAIVLDINYSSIVHCLRGKRKQAGNMTWEYRSPETIQFWSREDVITSRSAMHPFSEDEDIVHTIAKNRSYGEYDKGLITLARRSKTIKTISTEEVRANDTFEVQLGCGRKLVHSFDLTKERGEVIGYYCLVELENDGIQFAVMTKKQVEEHRNKFSKNYKSEDKENNWNKNFDAMAKKTCVIQALKLCPISIEALEAVRAEEISEIEGVSHADVKNGIYAEDIEYSVVDEVVEEVKEPVKEMAKKVNNPVYNKPEIQTPEISDEELAAMERVFETSGPYDGDIF